MAERRAQALALDRDLLRELLGAEELAICSTARRSTRSSARSRKGRSRTSCTTSSSGAATCRRREVDEALAAELEAERRAIWVRIGGRPRLIAAEDAGRYRDAVGAMPPGGLPDAFLDRR